MIASTTRAAESPGVQRREYYELYQFILSEEEQRTPLDLFLKNAAIPAANRLGIKPVGVFYPTIGFSPVYALFPHQTMESVSTFLTKMIQDQEFLSNGAAFLDAPASAPTFKRIETSVLVSFAGMPKLETPVQNADRVFQLRIYESPSIKTNLKKIEMFNDAGEIKIFRDVGLNPVFFGQAVAGTRIPNLTYMLAFKNMDEQKAAWQKFGAHPEWKRISKMPEYADKAILSNITNIQLTAAPYSQI